MEGVRDDTGIMNVFTQESNIFMDFLDAKKGRIFGRIVRHDLRKVP